jgi:hypothetical protein
VFVLPGDCIGFGPLLLLELVARRTQVRNLGLEKKLPLAETVARVARGDAAPVDVELAKLPVLFALEMGAIKQPEHAITDLQFVAPRAELHGPRKDSALEKKERHPPGRRAGVRARHLDL